MIAIPGNVRVWLATGYTDMRRGLPSLALQVQEVLHKDPLSGHLFVFRGRSSDLVDGASRGLAFDRNRPARPRRPVRPETVHAAVSHRFADIPNCKRRHS
ncbi:IS66 family insertion sequence element accessory protein TnpB [Bradyrhizobium sp. USDA 3458]|uniref:IS66 family insertion sequence element accessory protein TnpB n=1 Tax=Bradyrhizobium sp. USDA 3458 TaxID=2591461 RepID=UPI00114512B9|nr:IS66 family insertion sequence element accessory protein TnpB [Bradyrhizobium sp. USDA 3458]